MHCIHNYRLAAISLIMASEEQKPSFLENLKAYTLQCLPKSNRFVEGSQSRSIAGQIGQRDLRPRSSPSAVSESYSSPPLTLTPTCFTKFRHLFNLRR
ncbi:hypothetical protein L1887_01301 [Cichorium endivia]|nr:hypothetical protein L1887_01301 [Cichorium endivia]